MATFEDLDELMVITDSTELHKHMRFWFVQEITEEEGLLKFIRDHYDDLRRKSSRRRVLIRDMETLGEHGVVFDSLECLKQTHVREIAKLSGFIDVMTETLASIHEKEGHTDCNTTLENLRTQFENAFNSDFEECIHRYTRYNAQSFKDAMISFMDSIGKYMLEIILYQHRTPKLLKQTKLMQTQEDHSNLIRALNVDSLKVDSVVIQNLCSETEDSNSETASSKSVKKSTLNSATKDVHAIKYKMSKAKERCII
nr:hypothetical protein [Tanacetum cinerariifolium]